MSANVNLVSCERRLLIESNSDSPRVFEFLREKMIAYIMSGPKKSLTEACRWAYGELLSTDPGGTYNIILSNGYISFVFIHWRDFYCLNREKDTGDTVILSTLKLNQEDWVTYKKLSGKRARMLVFSGPTLIMNGGID